MTFKRFYEMLDGNKDGKIQEAEWEIILKFLTQPPPIPHGIMAVRLGGENDVTKTNIVWSEERAVPEVPAPLVYKERVYTVTNGGIASVLDAKTGKLIYRGRLGAGGLYYSSPIAAADRVYFCSGDGVVTVIQSDGESLQVLSRNDLGEPIFATPAIVEGKLYVLRPGVSTLLAPQNNRRAHPILGARRQAKLPAARMLLTYGPYPGSHRDLSAC